MSSHERVRVGMAPCQNIEIEIGDVFTCANAAGGGKEVQRTDYLADNS